MRVISSDTFGFLRAMSIPFRASVNDPPVWAMMNQMLGNLGARSFISRTTSSEGWIRQYACIRFPYSYQGNQTGSLYGMKVLG